MAFTTNMRYECHTERFFSSVFFIPVFCGQSLGPETAKPPTDTFLPKPKKIDFYALQQQRCCI